MEKNNKKDEMPRQVVCPNCLEENEPFQDFCKKCGAPLSAISTTGPLERKFARSFMYRQAIAGQRRPIIVIGMYVMFLPMLIGAVCMMIALLTQYEGGIPAKCAITAGIILFGLVPFTILFRTTKNYLKIRRKPDEEKNCKRTKRNS